MSKKRGKKAEITVVPTDDPNVTEVHIILPSPLPAEPEPAPEVVPENSLENSQIPIQECPSDACQELQDVWASGKGCHNPESKYCVACANDFLATAEICQKRTIEAQAKAVEKKITPHKTSSVGKGGYGHRTGTQAEGIDKILIAGGGTPEEILQRLVEQGYNRNQLNMDDLWRRTLTHFSDLKRNHGMKIVKVNGNYSVVV